MPSFSWRNPPLTSEQRSIARRELYATTRLDVAGVRAAVAGLSVGAVCLLGAQALSGVQLDSAWLPVVGLSIGGGLMLAAIPLLAGYGKPPKIVVDDDGIRIVGKQRLPWSQLRGWWTGKSVLGNDLIHLVSIHGHHTAIDLPPTPLARTIADFIHIHLRPLPSADRPSPPPPLLPAGLGVLSYTTIFVGGITAGLITFHFKFLSPDALLGMLAGLAAFFSAVVTFLARRIYRATDALVVAFATVHFMAIISLGGLVSVALVIRALQQVPN